MSKAKDFEISKGVLKKYTGPGGEVNFLGGQA